MTTLSRTGVSARLFSLVLAAAALAALVPAPVSAQENAIASKSIARVYPVGLSVFALAEGGQNFSWLDLFGSPEVIKTYAWPWDGGAQGGAAWSQTSPSRQSVILYANYFISDSQRVARAAAIRFELGAATNRSDSLIFKDTTKVTAAGAAFTAAAIRGDTAVFGFGRLGIVYSTLAPSELNPPLFRDSVVAFYSFPTASANAMALMPPCVWNRLCRSDTITVPAGGLDSVISVAIDSAGPDSVWLLIATQKGLRRGLWRGTSFPYVSLPGIADSVSIPVRSVFASPANNQTWAFTGLRFFFSDDHGATFRVPDSVPGISTRPSQLTNYATSLAPQVAFSGDTSFINFNMNEVGLVLFRNDTLLANAGMGLNEVLLNAEDSLDIRAGEGSLTGVTVARNGSQSVLVAGTTLKGVFYRRLDQPRKTFTNINRLRVIQRGMNEVITYPTLFEGPGTDANPKFVRIGYSLKKDGNVTITVYNYAMEKVRVLVKNRPRRGGIARSESVGEDRWDGRDSAGRLVSVGTYYIRVESDNGEAAFGKVICVRGRR